MTREIEQGDLVRYRDISLGILGTYKNGLVTGVTTSGKLALVKWPTVDSPIAEFIPNLELMPPARIGKASGRGTV